MSKKLSSQNRKSNKQYKYKTFYIDLLDLLIKNTQEITTEYSKNLEITDNSFSLIAKKTLDYISHLREVCSLSNSKFYFILVEQSEEILVNKIKYFLDIKYKNLIDYNEVSINVIVEILKNYDDSFRVVSMPFEDVQSLVDTTKGNRRNLFISRDIIWSHFLGKHDYWSNYSLTLSYNAFEKHYGFLPEKDKIMLTKIFLGKTHIDPNLMPTPSIPKEDVRNLVNCFNNLTNLRLNMYKTGLSKEMLSLLESHLVSYKINQQKLKQNYSTSFVEHYKFNCRKNLEGLNLWYKILDMSIEKWMKIPKTRSKKRRQRG